MKTNKEIKQRDEIKALKNRTRYQATELRKAGREILRLLKWKARHGGLTRGEQMTGTVWAITFGKLPDKR